MNEFETFRRGESALCVLRGSSFSVRVIRVLDASEAEKDFGFRTLYLVGAGGDDVVCEDGVKRPRQFITGPENLFKLQGQG